MLLTDTLFCMKMEKKGMLLFCMKMKKIICASAVV